MKWQYNTMQWQYNTIQWQYNTIQWQYNTMQWQYSTMQASSQHQIWWGGVGFRVQSHFTPKFF